jgi:hypothetical protein
MKIVGITGRKNSGKSTVASLLVQEFDYKEFAFADPLKQLLEILFFLEPQHLHDPDFKEQIIEEFRVSPRRLMQQIGTDLFRDRLVQVLPELDLSGHTFWIWHMQQRIERYVRSLEGTGKEPLIVISDLRFEDEIEFLRDLENNSSPRKTKLWILKIIRDRTDGETSVMTKHKSEEMSHTGENVVNICNNESLENLRSSVSRTIKDVCEYSII